MPRKRYPVHFTVRGSGDFPLDMLRYDNCVAATPADEAKILWNPDGDPIPEGAHGVYLREVNLIADAPHKGWQPASARWASFSWKVIG